MLRYSVCWARHGWVPAERSWLGNAIPNNPDRLFEIAGADGAAYAYQNGAATTAFFGSTGLDLGSSGLPFPNITWLFGPA